MRATSAVVSSAAVMPAIGNGSASSRLKLFGLYRTERLLFKPFTLSDTSGPIVDAVLLQVIFAGVVRQCGSVACIKNGSDFR